MNSPSVDEGRQWFSIALLLLGIALLAPMGCHTAEGVKQDTKSALGATGRGLQRGADKMESPKQDESKDDAKKDSHTSK